MEQSSPVTADTQAPAARGIYLVELLNEDPISVNAYNRRIAARCIHVRKGHCKAGRARNLHARERLYCRNFGAHHVVFRVLALLDDISACERRVLQELDPWRIRGRTGRKNEWLEGIDADEVVTRVLRAVREHEARTR